jgi:hypothetical protein
MTTLAHRPQQRPEKTAPTGAKVVVLRATQGEIDLRNLFDTPPDLRLDDVGAICPIDDTVLVTTRPAGLACPECLAAWPMSGRDGRWVDTVPGLPRTAAGRGARVLAMGGAVLAAPLAAAYATAPELADALDVAAVPELVIWVAAGALAATGAGIAAHRLVRGLIERGEVA